MNLQLIKDRKTGIEHRGQWHVSYSYCALTRQTKSNEGLVYLQENTSDENSRKMSRQSDTKCCRVQILLTCQNMALLMINSKTLVIYMYLAFQYFEHAIFVCLFLTYVFVRSLSCCIRFCLRVYNFVIVSVGGHFCVQRQ